MIMKIFRKFAHRNLNYRRKIKEEPDTLSDVRLFSYTLLYYLFTWNLVSPSLKKALICFAAAIPALILASAV